MNQRIIPKNPKKNELKWRYLPNKIEILIEATACIIF